MLKRTDCFTIRASRGMGYPLKPHPKGYLAYRAANLSINGKLDDPAWQAAAWTDEFMDIVGPDAATPWYKTHVKMLWDDEYLYIGALLEDPKPFATLQLHDSIVYHDNDFEVFIDPDGDNHLYYEFEINALNTVWDLFLVKPYRDGGPALMSWETISPSEATQADGPTGWTPIKRAVWVDGSLNDGSKLSRGWSVEMALPWSVLKQAAMRRCPPEPGDQWRINFSRVQWAVEWDAEAMKYVKVPPDQSENNWVWSPQWAVAMHQPEYWGYVQFSSSDVQQVAAGAALPTAFVPDPSWALRTFLMAVYYAEKTYFERHQAYTTDLHALGVEPPSPDVAGQVLIQTTEVGFLVGAQLPAGAEGQAMRYFVNEESRITRRLVKPPADTGSGGKGTPELATQS